MSKVISKHHNTTKEFTKAISANRNELMGKIQTLREFVSGTTGVLRLDSQNELFKKTEDLNSIMSTIKCKQNFRRC